MGSSRSSDLCCLSNNNLVCICHVYSRNSHKAHRLYSFPSTSPTHQRQPTLVSSTPLSKASDQSPYIYTTNQKGKERRNRKSSISSSSSAFPPGHLPRGAVALALVELVDLLPHGLAVRLVRFAALDEDFGAVAGAAEMPL